MSSASADSILDGLHFSQDRLDELCREPKLSVPEMTGMNTGFGMGHIFRQYASLPMDEPLTFSCDHGIPLNPEYVFPPDFEHGLPGYLAPYEERAAFLRKAGKSRVLTSAMPLHYVRKILENSGKWRPPSERRGTLVFPHKSTDVLDIDFDFEALAKLAASLPAKYQPVCVCIYWKDYLKDRHLAYLEAGHPLVTCGHFASPDFLPRLIDLATRFRYSFSNAIAGSYSLSAGCGCHFFYRDVGAVKRRNIIEGSEQTVAIPGAETLTGRRLLELAPYPPRADLFAKQQALTSQLTGADHVLPPETIRDLQNWGRRWLLERQPSEVSFIEDLAPAELNRWLPINVRKDGWTGPEFRIALGPSKYPRSFNLYFKLSPKICTEPIPLTLKVSRDRSVKFVCTSGRYRLACPVPAGEECSIWIALPAGIAEIEEIHGSKALRILGWKVGAPTVSQPVCEAVSRKKLPPYAAVPEGW